MAESTFTVTIDGETETYDLLIAGMTFAEARAVEKVTGHGFQEIVTQESLRSRTDVLQALLWVSMKRRRPTLTFADLDDIAIDSIEFASEEDEPAAPFEDAPGDSEDAPTSPPAGANI